MMNLSELAHLQRRWATEVVIPPDNTGYMPQANDVIFSLDIQYVGDRAFVGLDIQHYSGELMGTYVGETDVEVPYVPQFFCFREGPALLKMVNFIRDHFNIIPNVLLTDGHGIAHPRRFGVACWLGVQIDLPVIGCAKQSLLDYEGELADKRGSWLAVCLKNEIVGQVLRTQTGIKPIFVSSGHLISLSTAGQMILNLAPQYRVCNPLRRADQAARAYAKGKNLSGVTFLKTLS